MTTRDDSGPAFPAPEASTQHFGEPSVYMGMTLRDYFAAKAMQGDIASMNTNHNPATVADAIAARAYTIADAMLKARMV